jgi:hypothetical protein
MYAQRTATFVEVQMIAAEEDVGGQRLGWQEVQQAATLLGMRLVRDTITTPATAAVKGATGRGDVVGRNVCGGGLCYAQQEFFAFAPVSHIGPQGCEQSAGMSTA